MSKFAWFLGGVLVGGLVTDYLNSEQRRKEKLIKKFKDCQNEGVHYENNSNEQQPQQPSPQEAPADEKINFNLSQEEVIRRQEVFKNSASNIAEAFNMTQQEEAPKAKAEEKVDPLNEQIEKAFGPGPKVKLDISGNFGI